MSVLVMDRWGHIRTRRELWNCVREADSMMIGDQVDAQADTRQPVGGSIEPRALLVTNVRVSPVTQTQPVTLPHEYPIFPSF